MRYTDMHEESVNRSQGDITYRLTHMTRLSSTSSALAH